MKLNVQRRVYKKCIDVKFLEFDYCIIDTELKVLGNVCLSIMGL